MNKIEIRITFEIKTRHHLELLTSQIMKLLGVTKRKITKDGNGENLPYLEINEFIVILSVIIINKIQESSINFLQMSHSVNY